MSMVRCDDCDHIFSSDDDPECFVEVGNMRRMTWTIVVCETCRWLRNDERELEEHYASQAEDQLKPIGA